MRRFERFSDDVQAKCLSDFAHDFPAVFAEPLKRVGRASRFPHTAAEKTCTALLDRFGYSKGLLAILDRARPSDDRELAATDRRAVNAYNGFFWTQVQRDQLVRLCDADDFRNSSQTFKAPAIDRTLVSRNANGGPRCAWHCMCAQADRFDHVEDRVDVSRGRAWFHYD